MEREVDLDAKLGEEKLEEEKLEKKEDWRWDD